MRRNATVGSLFAATLGGILGYLALFLREMGWLLGAAGLAFLVVHYVRERRNADIGWLLFAFGIVPGAILARNGLTSVLDSAVEVGLDTWIALIVASAIGVVGAIVVLATWRSKTEM